MNLNDFGAACKILQMLENAGFEAYFVGGFVRSMLTGIDCNDFDITTNALPSQILSVFSNFKTYKTGLKHGTVTVSVNGVTAEITTYRQESSYSDNRHPDIITFCRNLSDDLLRRDFTVNAIAFNPHRGFTDLFGGFCDLQSKTIRCVGNANDRFSQDALRILRALRFSGTLGFKIEKETSAAIHGCKNLLKNISAERISAELSKILCCDNIKTLLLEYFDVFETIIPELSGMKGFEQHNFHHKYDVLEHTAVVAQKTEPELVLRLAALFHDCAKPECFFLDENGVGHFYSHASIGGEKTLAALKRLRFDNETSQSVAKLVKIHDSPIEESEAAIKRKLNRYGEKTLRNLIKLQKADTLGLADEYKSRLKHFAKLEEIMEKVLRDKQCFSAKTLAVSGYDIMAIGFQGRAVGRVLDFLVDAVIEKRVANEKEALLMYVSSNYKDDSTKKL